MRRRGSGAMLKPAAHQLLERITPPAHAMAGPVRRGRIIAADGDIVRIVGLPVPIGSAVSLPRTHGGRAAAEVSGFRDGECFATLLEPGAHIAPGGLAEWTGGSSDVVCGDALLGRIVDPLGVPLDGRGAIHGDRRWPLAGRPGNVLSRGRVTQPMDMGVRAINALLTAGRGQRIALIAGAGVGKSVLMGQMIAGAAVDRIVVALVGERGREVADFLETRLDGAARDKSVVVAVPADHPPALRLRAAMRATAIAEEYRSRGLNVLLLIDSLTRVAHAQREIGLAMGEPPTVKGYPPSALALIPRLVERAGVNRESGGAITAVYTVLADGDDLTDPVVDAARSIVDGHIVLSRHMAEQGIYPAIDVGHSLSRVMADIVDEDHLCAAAAYRRLWSAWEENRELVLMGAWREGTDPVLDAAIARRAEWTGFLAQAMDERVSLDTARAALIAGFGA
jgi:flagellum-specific ATP synthase